MRSGLRYPRPSLTFENPTLMSLTQNGTSGHSRGDSTAATVGASSQWTHRWSEMDSNFRFRARAPHGRAISAVSIPTPTTRASSRTSPALRRAARWRPGDPRLHAFSLIGPMVMVMPFREVFGGVGTDPPDLGLCIPRLLRRPRRRSGIKASTGGRGPMKKQRIYPTHQLCPVS